MDGQAKHDANDCFWNGFARKPGNPYILPHGLSSFRSLFVHLTHKNDLSSEEYPIAFGTMASLVRMNGGTAAIDFCDPSKFNAGKFTGYNLISFFPTVTHMEDIIRLAKTIKNAVPDSHICLLNSEQHQHELLLGVPRSPDLASNLMAQCPEIDFILVGEAEDSFLMLCSKIWSGGNGYQEIDGCFFRNDDGVVSSGQIPGKPVDFEYLPYPSRDHLEKSIGASGINTRSVRVQSSRGCVSACRYCVESSANKMRKKPWSGRSVVTFVDEIELLARKYGVLFFNIMDSSFEDPGARGIERMRAFSMEIRERRLRVSFKMHFRAETFDNLDDGFMCELKDAGADVLVIGAESGLARELKSYNKIATAEKTASCINKIDRFGRFFALTGHMMFSAFLQLDELPEKAGFLRRINRGWDYLNLSNNLLVFRGTAYHDHLIRHGLALDAPARAPLIPYRFEDGRIRDVARETGSIKARCPAVIGLQNAFYDARNIESRYFNRINAHLWGMEAHFESFRRRLDGISGDVQDVYLGYFMRLVELAGAGWNQDSADILFDEYISKSIPVFYASMQDCIKQLLDACHSKALTTDRLLLKTWMSLINSDVNTSGGGVAGKLL